MLKLKQHTAIAPNRQIKKKNKEKRTNEKKNLIFFPDKMISIVFVAFFSFFMNIWNIVIDFIFIIHFTQRFHLLVYYCFVCLNTNAFCFSFCYNEQNNNNFLYSIHEGKIENQQLPEKIRKTQHNVIFFDFNFSYFYLFQMHWQILPRYIIPDTFFNFGIQFTTHYFWPQI